MRKIKRWIGIVFAVLIACVAVLAIKGPPKVPPEAIAHAVNREPALLERAWALPVARLYNHDVYWQKNGSFCGPATLLNLFASQGQRFANEAAILEGSGMCWS